MTQELVPGTEEFEVDLDGVEGIRIKAHPSLCQGWGQCHRWAPDVYPLDADGHIDVHVVAVPANRVHDAELGALACPDHVISIIRPS